MAQSNSPARTSTGTNAATPPPRRESWRDTVEQLVVALILAFLVRGFSAEAFVIPTGSMAPTLMGRHKEVDCPQCGRTYPVNASDDLEESTLAREAANPNLGKHLEFGTCDNCRYRTQLEELPSFKGDRILVMKFLYSMPFLGEASGPRRWEVVVFKYPEKPDAENYIKRLVGMPNEDLRVYFGNILTRPLGSAKPFTFERRPLSHQQSMQMLVFDDRHRPKAFAGLADWKRWQGSGAWKDDETSTYRAVESADWSWLRYKHLVPGPSQWESILAGSGSIAPPKPSLISDFYSYNTFEVTDSLGRGDNGSWFQPHWVGDLTVSFRLAEVSAKGIVRVELVRGGVAGRCEIDLSTGKATLFSGEKPLAEPRPTGIVAGSDHEITFANVDGRLTLWVDGETPFDEGVSYDDGNRSHPIPTTSDLDPVGIGVKGGSARVSDLVLKRDIYYTQTPGYDDYSSPLDSSGRRIEDRLARLSDPAQFAFWSELKWKDYPIRPGHYMMMGDNSPRSKDGRGWGRDDQQDKNFPEIGWDPNNRESWEVPRALLIGKAFYIYWPHGVPFGPKWRLNRDFRIPFRPYFERMKWIR